MLVEALDVLSKVAALAAAYVAYRGLTTWRRDFVGKRRAELAEDALTLFYQARDAIDVMRQPFSWGSEMDHLVRGETESDISFKSRQNVAPLFKRYENYSVVFSDLLALRYRYMARFGKDAARSIDDLIRLKNEILHKANFYVQLWSVQFEPAERERQVMQDQARQEAEAYFWDHGDMHPYVSTRLKEIVTEFECQAHPEIALVASDEDPVLRWVGLLWERIRNVN